RALAELRELFLARYVIDYDYLEEIIGEPLPTPLKQNIIGIDLPAFWNNPPADLRDLLPTLEVVRSNVYEAGHTDYLVAAARIGDETFGDWPDSGGAVTLGGLLSPGVDEDNVLLLAPISGVLESEGSDPGFLAFFLSDGSWVTDDFLPWTGARTFTVPNSVGGGTTTVTIEDNGDTAARATSYEEVEVTISTSDGVLNNTPTEVNWVTTGEGNVIAYIRGTATDTDSREVVVNVWLSGSGSDHSLSVTVTDEAGLVTFYQGEGPVTL
ncbi:MAG: hypothetical protein HUU35_19280, partial [Armatimonadetes bacterium]|nr:hypothetical protein [Armatimonadota bacterium]